MDAYVVDRMQAAEPDTYGVRPAGWRLPDATRVGTVRLQVGDLARSLAYYRDVLGFRVAAREPGRASLAAPGSGRTLVELVELRGASPVPRRGRLGLYHFAVLLPGRAALGRFVAHLRRAGVGAGMSDHLVSEAVYLTDPDGLGIEVYADRPRASWRRAGTELRMATEPLDVADVIRAGGGEPWDGLPTGTTIGHVHLFVGDLQRSSAFYHDALGLDRTVWSYPGALFLSAGGYHHHLGTNTWAAGADPAGEADARLLEWELLVPSPRDVEATAASLVAAGHAVERGLDAAVARDPWGTAVRVAVDDAA